MPERQVVLQAEPVVQAGAHRVHVLVGHVDRALDAHAIGQEVGGAVEIDVEVFQAQRERVGDGVLDADADGIAVGPLGFPVIDAGQRSDQGAEFISAAARPAVA